MARRGAVRRTGAATQRDLPSFTLTGRRPYTRARQAETRAGSTRHTPDTGGTLTRSPTSSSSYIVSALAFLLLALRTTGAAATATAADTVTADPTPVSGDPAPPDFYSHLVTLPSTVFGEVTKAGPLPASRYDDTLFNHTIFREWLAQRVVYRQEPPPGPPPMSYKCGIFVNHHYKIIFIRNRKAASTTVLETFKSACRSQSKLLCMHPFDSDELRKRGLSHDEMWRSYYVVSSTRNPWARAASGFDYTLGRWPVKTGVCGTVSFRQFCTDPYVMGKVANLFRCGTQNSFRGDDTWAYDFYHVEPAYHCLTTEDAAAQPDGAGLAVDYLIRYEHLHQDFAALVDILNSRRDPSLPEIRNGKVGWMKQGPHTKAPNRGRSLAGRGRSGKDGSAAAVGALEVAEAPAVGDGGMWKEDSAALVAADRHAVRYRSCGMECVRAIGTFFEGDLRLMGLQVPSSEAR